MTIFKFLAMLICLLAVPALAQDPGTPDSLIIGTATMDSGAGGALVPLWATTDDTVIFVNLPIRWQSIDGQIRGADAYHSPPDYWDEYGDTVDLEQSYFRILAWNCIDIDTIPHFLYTENRRVLIFTLRFAIFPDAVPQMVPLDTTVDYYNGPVMFGLQDGMTVFAPIVIPGSLNYGPVKAYEEEAGQPSGFSLNQNYPNPFNATTTITYAIPSAGLVKLEIYDILGRVVVTPVNTVATAGEHVVDWNGKSMNGNEMSSGIYFCCLSMANNTIFRKMLLIH